MKLGGFLLAAALVAGCAESIALSGGFIAARALIDDSQAPGPWYSTPTGHVPPPEVPMVFIPERADFSFLDEATDRRYWIQLYQDHEVLADRVTVHDPGGDVRTATFEETSFAYAYYKHHWRHRSQADRLEYLRRPPNTRQAVPAPLLHEHIRLKEHEVGELAANALELEAQFRALGPTGEPVEKRRFVALRLDETRRELARAEGELALLRDTKAVLYGSP